MPDAFEVLLSAQTQSKQSGCPVEIRCGSHRTTVEVNGGLTFIDLSTSGEYQGGISTARAIELLEQ